jgi:hypothetical protein
MSLKSVRSLVSRMAKDPEFKKQIASDHDALSKYDLTADERSAVGKLSTGTGHDFDAVPFSSWF